MNKCLLTFLCFCTLWSSAQQPKSLALQFANENTSLLFAVYKQMHAHPEISTKELHTAAFLKNEMKTLGYKIVDSMGYYNFAAVLENGIGTTVLYRTDMDGLPVFEKTGLSYASKDSCMKEGVAVPSMHACGHDMHMTTWLGLAKFLSTHKKNWKGTIIFLAQSAEETAQGAKAIVSSESFSKLPTCDIQLSIHNNAELPTGTFGFCNGYAMAAVDMMDITIFGKGGHGAAPQNTIDPIVLSAQYINAIQTIVSRNLSSNDPAVITVGAIHGGTVGNVVPDQVQLKLTIRSYSEASRKIILQRLKEIGDNMSRGAGLTEDKLPQYKLLDMSIPAVYNNPELGDRLSKIIKSNFGDTATKVIKPVMIGEDFSVYGLRNIPSYLIWTGTIANEEKILAREKNPLPSLHSAQFAPDAEVTIRSNITMMAVLLLELMKN